MKFVLVAIFIFLSPVLFAQFSSLPSNLSNVRSADISNEQLSEIKSGLNRNNMTSQQAYDMAVARGMSQSEAANLRDRLENATTADVTNGVAKNLPGQVSGVGERRMSDTTNNTIQVNNPRKIFGLEIFNNGVLSFEPNINIATPTGYVIGTNDEININIFGYQEAKYNLKVGPEGDINIPYVGVMYVSGLTVDQATAKIKSKLAAAGYANIRTGLTKVAVSIGKIRNIKITLLGEVKRPGSYSLPSLATAFNALYLSGGPTEVGSMRNIEIIRNGRVIDILDIYDFLVKGTQKGNVNLQDQDIIRIPAYKVRVALEGEVKRTGLFEMKPNETLETLLDFAGGFSDSAYTASITGYKTTDVENKIIDITQKEFSTYKPSRSESFLVKKIIGRFVNRVTISGAVYLPGDYELSEGMTIKDLIEKARGLREDAYKGRGLILRNQKDLTLEYLSFNPIEVMQQSTSSLLLKPNDRVTITAVSQLQENTTVNINGEVRKTGTYAFVKNMSLKDLILLAGGFTDAGVPQQIEIGRRMKSDTFSIGDIQIAEVINVTSVKDLETRGADIKLQSYDVVIVRKNPTYEPQIAVSVVGEVVFPGAYILTNKNDRISSVIKRAGGITFQAYEQGVYITRNNLKSLTNQINTEKIIKIQETLKDSSGRLEAQVERNYDQIAIDLGAILAHPGSKDDLILEEGDVITIPKEKMDVRISGQVLFPTRVVYDNKLNLKDYLGRAGGIADNARKGKIYVLYPNGNAAKTSSFLFFKKYPTITSGSEIIVPKKYEIERRRLSTGELIGITTAITSFAGVVLSVILNSKR